MNGIVKQALRRLSPLRASQHVGSIYCRGGDNDPGTLFLWIIASGFQLRKNCCYLLVLASG